MVMARRGVGDAFVVFFFAGWLIFPIATLACRLVFRRTKESPNNPLGGVALESTIAMIAGLFVAWLFLPFAPQNVFPIAAIAVGTHYFAFGSAYGDRLFWLLGALITAVGVLDLQGILSLPFGTILAVALIELVFAIVLTLRSLRMEATKRGAA